MSQSQEYSVLPLEPRLKPIPTNDFLTLSEKVANRITEMSDGIKNWTWVVLWFFISEISKSIYESSH
jgi:hypothetical protein